MKKENNLLAERIAQLERKMEELPTTEKAVKNGNKEEKT